MPVGARTPEELETLLEDAFVLHDPRALAQLFQPGAMLVVGGGLPEARGHRQIARVATRGAGGPDLQGLQRGRRVRRHHDLGLAAQGGDEGTGVPVGVRA